MRVIAPHSPALTSLGLAVVPIANPYVVPRRPDCVDGLASSVCVWRSGRGTRSHVRGLSHRVTVAPHCQPAAGCHPGGGRGAGGAGGSGDDGDGMASCAHARAGWRRWALVCCSARRPPGGPTVSSLLVRSADRPIRPRFVWWLLGAWSPCKSVLTANLLGRISELVTVQAGGWVAVIWRPGGRRPGSWELGIGRD
jgi:hypothetical protein